MLPQFKKFSFVKYFFLKKVLIFGILYMCSAAVAQDGPVGFASLDGGTTGGKGGKVISVSNKSDFEKAVAGSEKRIVEVSGMIELGKGVFTPVGSNITITGKGDAKIKFGGIHLKGSKNVIIKNITFMDPTGVSDCIYISDEAQNIWIDHCTLTGDPTPSHEEHHDHTIDVRTGSKNITVSYCEFHNVCQNFTIGGDNNNGTQDKNISVTIHGCWFNGTMSRNPRIRFARVHVFNCLYNDNVWRDYPVSPQEGYGIASTCEAKTVVENCYFNNTTFPTHIDFPPHSPAGDVVSKNNITEKCDNEILTRGTAFDPSKEYKYTPIDPKDVPEHVKKYAGAGKETPPTPIKQILTDNVTKKDISISILNTNKLIIKNIFSGNSFEGTFTIYTLSGKKLTQYNLIDKKGERTAALTLPENIGAGNYYYRFVNNKDAYAGVLQLQ